jgi:DNA-binding Lrp family transcriptional regulator
MTTFTSSVLGEVNHPINILKEYKQAFGRIKASILTWIDGWLKTRIAKGLNKWVRLTLNDVAVDLGYCKKTIHKHLRELVEMGILVREKAGWFPTDTSHAYKINTDVILRYLCSKKKYTASGVFGNQQQCNHEPLVVEKCATYIDSSLTSEIISHTQQDSAAVEEEVLEVDWDALKNKVEEEQARLVSECLVTEEQVTLVSNQEEPDQTTDTLCVDKQTSVDLSNEPIKREDNHSAVVCKVKTVTTSKEIESNKPYQEEISEIRRELRQLRINPEACMSAVLRHWGNVNNALARVREALADGWCKNPEGLFISSCKNGAKPQKSAVATGFNQWFDWARKQRIALASTTIDGVHCVMLDDRWIPTAKAMQMYPNASASPYCVAEPQDREMES